MIVPATPVCSTDKKVAGFAKFFSRQDAEHFKVFNSEDRKYEVFADDVEFISKFPVKLKKPKEIVRDGLSGVQMDESDFYSLLGLQNFFKIAQKDILLFAWKDFKQDWDFQARIAVS